MPFRTSRPLGVRAAKRELASPVSVKVKGDRVMVVFMDPLVLSTPGLGKEGHFDGFKDLSGIDGF